MQGLLRNAIYHHYSYLRDDMGRWMEAFKIFKIGFIGVDGKEQLLWKPIA